MSGLANPDQLLAERGVEQQLDAFVVATAFSRDGAAAAFALGDGAIALVARAEPSVWRRVAAHDGAVLALAPAVTREGFLSGGDDGAFMVVNSAGEKHEIARFGMKWVEHVASHASGVMAAAVGKKLHLFDAQGAPLKVLDHPSAITGLAFDAKGKRVAAAHYNGVSLWFIASKSANPRRLEWKGSHTALAFSPDGDVVVTAMQENALHGWRLSSNEHMRMSGYPAKTAALSFSRGGKWLATSGADTVVLWPFTGGGPMGKPPVELAGGDNVMCTYVACHPAHEAVAAGFADGLVVLADIDSHRILPVCGPGRGPVSTLAWSPDGAFLAIGTESGAAALIDFSKR
jgi:WD40 repeat protein